MALGDEKEAFVGPLHLIERLLLGSVAKRARDRRFALVVKLQRIRPHRAGGLSLRELVVVVLIDEQGMVLHSWAACRELILVWREAVVVHVHENMCR